MYPEPPCPAASKSTPHPTASTSSSALAHEATNIQHALWNPFHTIVNNFGLWKECLYCPSHDSDALISPEDLYRPHISAVIPELDRPEIDEPCLSSNKTVDMLLNWQHDSSPGKSNEDLDTLVHDILLHPDFDLRELKSFNAACENRSTMQRSKHICSPSSIWTSKSMYLLVAVSLPPDHLPFLACTIKASSV